MCKIGYKRHAVIYGIDVIRQHELEKLYFTLNDRYNKLLEKQNDVELFISDIQDSKTRQIFEHRYIDQMEWYQVALAMGFNNEDTPRKKHDRFLEKI